MALPFSPRISDVFTLSAGQTGPMTQDWKLFNAADLAVYRRRAGVVSLRELNVDYTVAGVGDPEGFSVTLAAGATEGDQYVLVGARPVARTSTITSERGATPTFLNNDLDQTFAQVQEIAREVARAFKTDIFDPSVFNLEGRRLTNIAPAVNDGDVLTKGAITAEIGAVLSAAEGYRDEAAADRVQTGLDAAATAADRVQTGLDAAATAADRALAESARDAALLAGNLFDDTTDGLAGTSEGDYFSVPSPEDDELLILCRHDSGPAATEVDRYPNHTAVARWRAVNVLGVVGGAVDVDLSDGHLVVAALNGVATTFSFSNAPAAANGSFRLLLANGARQDVDWPATVLWEGGAAPELSEAGTDIIDFSSAPGGLWYGTVIARGLLPTGLPDDPVGGLPIFHADYENEVFVFHGMTFGSEAAFNAAVAGSISGNTRLYGPVPVPGAPNLVVNGTFDTDTASWTGFTQGDVGTVSISSESGRLKLDASGATIPAASQQISGHEVGRAYGLSAVVQNGTSGGNKNTQLRQTQNGNPIAATPSALNPSSPTTAYCFGAAEGGFYVNLQQSGTGVNGTFFYDDVELREVSPFAGYVVKLLGATIEATTPADVPVSDQVFFEASGRLDSGSSRNHVRGYQNSSGEIRVVVLQGAASVASFNFGVIAPSTPFKVDLALKNNRLVAWLNGGDAQWDSSGTIPGAVALRTGRSSAGNTWLGTVERLTVYGNAVGRSPGNAIRTEGDSYMGGAGGVSLPSTLQTAMNRAVINTGVGGSEMSGVRDRVLLEANADLLPQVTVFWDGSQNGYTTAAEYADILATAIAALGHNRFIVIPAAVPYGGSTTQALAIAAEFESRWPNNYLDWRDHIANTSGVINQNRMLNYPTDSWHLNQTAMNEMAAGIEAFIDMKGW